MPNMVTRLNLLADEPGTLEGLSAQLALDARFLYLALSLQRGVRPDLPIRTFRLSINYLMGLFAAFIADHYCNLLL
jgi:heme O synthase-like polyprenyltransferase